MALNTPVAFIIFNRPEKTARVFAEIRKARPQKLFIIADAPRTPEEKTKTDAARATTEQIDWPCEVRRLYQEKNLGIKAGPPAGISRVFAEEERAIFLEDDCLPGPTFFPYCEELLDRYAHDERVMLIAGSSYQDSNPRGAPSTSYYFSLIPNLWGWASWRRAWQHAEHSPMQGWPELKNSRMWRELIPNGAAREWWQLLFDKNYAGTADTWEGPWLYTCVSRGLCATPSHNLISNIGIDPEAAHWRPGISTEDENANMPTHPMEFPLLHPEKIEANHAADEWSHVRQFNINRYWGQRVRWFFKSRFPTLYPKLKRALGR